MSSNLKSLYITIVRHGESNDNLDRYVWTGWRDSPLSDIGYKQADALGKSLSQTPLKAIYSSPLGRAWSTAQGVYDAQAEPKPQFIPSDYLRAQNYGVAEGTVWVKDMKPGLSLTEHFEQGIYPVLPTRSDRFPQGESSEDLARRAEQFAQEIILPHVWDAARQGSKGTHILIVTHGLLLVELLPAILRMGNDGYEAPDSIYNRMANSGWTQLTIDVKAGKESEALSFSDDHPPPLEVRVSEINRHEHLEGVGFIPIDPNEKEVRTFENPADSGSK